MPVLAGAGSNDTRAAVEKSQGAGRAGRAGRALASARTTTSPRRRASSATSPRSPTRVTVPVVVYNVPGRTGSNIDTKTLLRLAAHPNITAVKEASGNLGQIMEILRDRPAGFEVLSGDDAFTLAVHGARRRRRHLRGRQPGAAARCTTSRRPARAGDFAEARRIHNRLLRLMNLNFVESNPIPVKASLALLGLCEESFRLPLCPPTEATREALREALRELELLT